MLELIHIMNMIAAGCAAKSGDTVSKTAGMVTWCMMFVTVSKQGYLYLQELVL